MRRRFLRRCRNCGQCIFYSRPLASWRHDRGRLVRDIANSYYCDRVGGTTAEPRRWWRQ